MFLPDADIETGTLRQGDIISAVHILGAINLNSITYGYTADDHDTPQNWSVPNAPNITDAMILSHSCEIDPENKVKLTSIILAPLRDVHKATNPDRVQELIDSNLIDTNSPEASYLKYFYVPEHPELSYKNGAVVDFSKCFSVRNQSYDHLVGKKIAQLTMEAALNMSLKLSLFFHRNQAAA